MKKGCIGCLGSLVILLIIGFGALLYFGPAYGVNILPPSPQQYAEAALKKMDFGLYAGPDWPQQKKQAMRDLQSAKTYQDTYLTLKKMAELSGGKHSHFYSSSEIKKEKQTLTTLPDIQLSDGILKIKLPAFMGDDRTREAYITRLRDGLSQTGYQAVILDLQQNSGGDIYPMLAGLATLLPDDDLFHFIYKDGSKETFNLDQIIAQKGLSKIVANPKKVAIKKHAVPIAILIDGQTAGSGELTALAFKNLPNVKMFGQATAGYTSGNIPYLLYDGALLQLTTSHIQDRSGKIYENTPVEPDQVSYHPLEDAQNWLKEMRRE